MLGIFKSLFSAFTWQLITDALSAVLRRIKWTVVLERLITRAIISGLRWLEKMDTNDVLGETVELIANMLEEKRLVKAKEYQQQQDKRKTSR